MNNSCQTISDLITNNFEKDLANKILATKKDVLTIESASDFNPSLTDSKIGGYGYLPRNMEYPKTEEGIPLYFLAQFNMEQLPAIDNLPNKGILSFYCGFELDILDPINSLVCYTELLDDNDPNSAFTHCVESPEYYLGFSKNTPLSRKGYQVLYFEDITQEPWSESEIDALFTQEFIEQTPINGQVKVNCYKDCRYLTTQSIEFEKYYQTNIYDFIEKNDEIEEVMEEIWDVQLDYVSTLLGYPINIEHDYRTMLPKKYHEYILLLQLDSNFNEKDYSKFTMMWGDVGIGKFFIHPDDLKKKDFSKVWFYWDSN